MYYIYISNPTITHNCWLNPPCLVSAYLNMAPSLELHKKRPAAQQRGLVPFLLKGPGCSASKCQRTGFTDVYRCLHYLSIYISICLSIHTSIHASIHPSIYFSFFLPVCLSIFLSACLYVCLSICLSIRLSICLSVYL